MKILPNFDHDTVDTLLPRMYHTKLKNGGRNDDVDAAVFGRHHAIVTQHWMLLATHRLQLGGSHNDGMRRNKDQDIRR
jgi:hypothetical protein